MMPYTARISGPLARHLLGHPNEALRRRLSVLRSIPFPPGSRSLEADEDWVTLAPRFPGLRAFIYGTDHDAVIYTYDPAKHEIVVHLAVLDGAVVPAPA